jgi:cobalt-precorrin 5A hydrolase/precorrin-3B C17-methyltransferase
MSTGNSIAALYVTDDGRLLAGKLKRLYPDLKIIRFARGKTKETWEGYKSLIFIMAAGIVVRTIAPLIKDKKTDPAVIVLDEKGRHAVSLLSGHLGGANERAREIAGFLGGEAVITTASDVDGLTSIDLWARDNDLEIEDWKLLPRIATRLINRKKLTVYSDMEMRLPHDFSKVADPACADLLITNRISPLNPPLIKGGRQEAKGSLYLRPKNLVVGIGCNRGTSADEIERVLRKTLDEHNLSFTAVRSIATIDLKADEPGIGIFSKRHSLAVLTFGPEELNTVPGISRSEAAFRATGAKAVAEPAAILASGAGALLVPKQKAGNVTVAVAEIRKEGVAEVETKQMKTSGKIYVVGTGPGRIEHITPYAQQAIRNSDIVVGYGTYVDLVRDLIRDKEVFSTGMTQEIDRCRKAVELASAGKTVSVISGGDPGIYAMAGLVYEIVRSEELGVTSHEKNTSHITPHASRLSVEVIPGISALNACAARLGAPLMHDFASISLSDRLTPWDLIEKRLDAASVADFVIVLYNPKSKGRTGHIGRAREIILRHRSPETPVGIVKGAMREDERIVITDLEKMHDHEIDMQTTVIIGNSRTFLWNNLMITPRGYEKKFDI